MIYTFGQYSLNTDTIQLTADGTDVAVEPQVFSLMQFLIENRERVVSKDEIIEEVWDGRIVSDGTLNSRINAARRALGDDGKAQAVIKTFPRRGFKFVLNLTDGAGAATLHSASNVAAAFSGKPSIAVLPFENLSGDPEQDYFSDGMTGDLITALSRLRWLMVIGRGTTATYKGQSVDPQTIAKDLQIRYVVEGSVRTAGDNVRITAQLTDGETGGSLWAARYDRKLDDIFEVQDDITEKVAASLESELGRAEQVRANSLRPENLDAWAAYQKAVSDMYNKSVGDYDNMTALLDKAVSLDPNFALAHAAIGLTEYWFYVIGSKPIDAERGYTHAQRAIELDPNEPYAHMALASIYWADDKLANANEEYRLTIELNPSFAWAYQLFGAMLLTDSRPAEAIEHLETAIRLSPRDPVVGIFYGILSLGYLVLKDYEECVKWSRRAIAYPQPRWAHAYLLSALGHLGDIEEAKEILSVIARLRPEFSISQIRNNFPILREALLEHFLDGLRHAGMRED